MPMGGRRSWRRKEVNVRFGGTLPEALGCSASHSVRWRPLSGMPLVGGGGWVEVTSHGEPGSPQKGASAAPFRVTASSDSKPQSCCSFSPSFPFSAARPPALLSALCAQLCAGTREGPSAQQMSPKSPCGHTLFQVSGVPWGAGGSLREPGTREQRPVRGKDRGRTDQCALGPRSTQGEKTQ